MTTHTRANSIIFQRYGSRCGLALSRELALIVVLRAYAAAVALLVLSLLLVMYD